MKVADILESKGSRIISVASDCQATEIAAILRSEGIGVVVVLGGDQSMLGIVSERDIVGAIAERGEAALQLTAADVMSRSVITCTPDTSTTEIMEQMLENQIRHLPVSQNGSLVGIISIGDVVRAVHGEMKWMTRVLQDQVVTSAGWSTDEV